MRFFTALLTTISLLLPAMAAADANAITADQLLDRLLEREAQIIAQIAETEKQKQRADLLRSELNVVQRNMVNIEVALAEYREKATAAEARLAELSGQVPAAQLAEAKAALGTGDLSKADAIFAEISAEEDAAIARKAEAEFGRGEIAEAEVRWADAARHYGQAARLAPGFGYLLLRRRLFAWRSGDYRNALRFGEDLIDAARDEFGEASAQYGAALSEHGLSLHTTGRHDEAEPLYREALEVTRAALGKEHADYATEPQQSRGAAR